VCHPRRRNTKVPPAPAGVASHDQEFTRSPNLCKRVRGRPAITLIQINWTSRQGFVHVLRRSSVLSSVRAILLVEEIPVFIAPLLRRDGDQRQCLLSACIHHREEEHYGVQRTFGSQIAVVVQNQ
jgi:hypothetical protein